MNHLLNQTSCLSAGEIQRYLNGEADDALRFRVEDHLLDCSLCAAAVEGFAAAGEQGRAQAGAEIEALRREMADRAGEAPRRSSLFNWAAAAAVLVVMAVSGWLYRRHTSDERLFASAFQPAEHNQLALRSEQTGARSAELDVAVRLYDAGNFEAGLPHFRTYLAENPGDFDAALFAGIAALEAGQTEQAVAWLERVRFNHPEQYAPATWYLALAHIRRGNREEGAALLEELEKANDEEWSEEAGVLLQKIRGRQ